MIEIILNTGKVVEKWEEARKNQGRRTPKIQEKPEWKRKDYFRATKDFKRQKEFNIIQLME
jgi:hypothetical protein